MRIGVTISVDVTKLDEERYFKGKKGTYLDLTAWIDPDKEDEYGNHGLVKQSTSKEEREAGVDLPILGNTKVFYRQGGSPTATPKPVKGQSTMTIAELEDDIPF